jgi:hypothetical protein
MARPLKLTDAPETLAQVQALGKIQCTMKEAAAVLGVTEKTFIEFLQRFKKANEAFVAGKEAGRASLRRQQWKLAESGHATMQIWLGKQYLGQADKNAVEYSADADFLEVVRAISSGKVRSLE